MFVNMNTLRQLPDDGMVSAQVWASTTCQHHLTATMPNRLPERSHGYIIHTRPWQSIADFYRERVTGGIPLEPMHRLVAVIGASSVAHRLFGATCMFDLLLSDRQDFREGDRTLRISYLVDQGKVDFLHCALSGHNDYKTCAETEALPMLVLFLSHKYGVALALPGV